MLPNLLNVRFRILLALFLAPVFVEPQNIQTVKGVRVIHNEKGGKWGANPEIQLELVRTIGRLDAEENLSFSEPNDIVQDSSGNLYILGSGNNRIQELDSEGKFIKTIGRKGQGPGEFQAVSSMDIDAETHHGHGIRIFGDSLFIREYDNTIFCQYRIIENEGH
jgi:hypothetical protein